MSGQTTINDLNCPKSQRCTLEEDMEKLFKNPKHCDCVLYVEDKALECHRSILGSRSTVFENIFDSGRCEIYIEKFTTEVIKMMLMYMYTSKTCNLTLETSMSLSKAAAQFDLPHLRSICLEFLKNNLTQATSLRVYLFALKYDIKDLQNAAMDLVASNATVFMKSEMWMDFLKSYPEKANSIILHIISKHNSIVKELYNLRCFTCGCPKKNKYYCECVKSIFGSVSYTYNIV